MEDDRDLRAGLEYAMKKESWEPISAKTLEEAWELADSAQLILLNVRFDRACVGGKARFDSGG